jgi:hypothetical protein
MSEKVQNLEEELEEVKRELFIEQNGYDSRICPECSAKAGVPTLHWPYPCKED